ncbi:class F sortase [Candidatus Saccharibacteria bacterium]|nr:class F sortase [Candidatus Saccharibacteria bacterium]
MELRKHLDLRVILTGIYLVFLTVYVVIGLQPVDATQYVSDAKADLRIPSIGLESDVVTLQLEGRVLNTPNTIAGSFSNAENKTLLIGHSSTVFHDLNKINVGDEIIYNENHYTVQSAEVLIKADINMNKILQAEEKDTLIVMTCAGELLGGGDATHRLIVTATR